MSSPLPLSKVRRAGDFVFLSGELPFTGDGSVPEGIEAQTELTLQRISATLASEGLTLADVVSVAVYLTEKGDFAGFNEVYRRHFADPFPTRTTVIAGLVAEARIEITVTAQSRA
ncbi:RidA family protein [Aureimonas populi]|uniref:RidA family protein n=1 Tax=Aureimonas populi TaxID=1701758 RepID=A0ABW5CPR0_9HYPH|nr:RidA family protein [Aureimonas populi]